MSRPDYIPPTIELGSTEKEKPAIMESFSWVLDDFMLQKSANGKSIKIRGIATPKGAISLNSRAYLADEMHAAARTFVDAPITVNHADWTNKKNHVGKINWMEYDVTDGNMEYIGEVWNRDMMAELRVYQGNKQASKLRGVSIEADYLHLVCPKCGEKFATQEEWADHMANVEHVKDALQVPHGILGRALSLVIAPETPGVEGSTLEVMETKGRGFNALMETVAKEHSILISPAIKGELTEKIEQRDGKYCVIDPDSGKPVECFDTREKAVALINSMHSTAKETVEKRGDQWCVVHCSGPDAGKAIKCFDSKEEAEAMHRAILANETAEKLKPQAVQKHDAVKEALARIEKSEDSQLKKDCLLIIERADTTVLNTPQYQQELAELKRYNDAKDKQQQIKESFLEDRTAEFQGLTETIDKQKQEITGLKEKVEAQGKEIREYENIIDKQTGTFKAKAKVVIQQPEVSTTEPYSGIGQ